MKHQREPGREAQEPEQAPPEARRLPALLALQQSAGNQAVTRALLHRAPKDPPEGVSLPADPLPAGANVADPDAARIAPDPSLPGGWNDKTGKSESGKVGGVDRILLEGLPGNQQQQTDQKGAPAHAKDVADTAGTGPAGSRGRAIAIVPHAVKAGPAGEVAVVVHFHGIGKALRERGDNPRDVDHYQIEQQLEGFVTANPGARIVALLPIGVQTEATTKDDKKVYGVSFGNFDTDAFVQKAFGALGGELPSGSTPGDVILSAHSGGGLQLGSMLTSGKGLPGRMKGVFLFEALHKDVDNYIGFVKGRLEADLKALEAAQATGVFDADIFKAQAAYLQGSLHVVAFGGTDGYKQRTLAIREAVLKWWEKNAKRLKAATDPHTVLLDTLWSHYQAQAFPGSTHENALATSANNLGRALASLEKTGALAPAPAPAKATVAPKRRLARKPWDLSQDPVVVVKPDDKKKQAKVTAAPADYVPEVLTDAGFKPDDWLSNFATTTFLGQPVGEPIHNDLVAHLKTVEASFATKYGGGKPEEAGKALGLREGIIGSRHKPTSAAVSMHLFGLAIDVNYTTNPFISASANPVFERANKLLGRTIKGFRNGMNYDQLAELDTLLVDYFALLKDESKDADTRKQIQQDLEFVTGRWERKEPAQKAAIEAGGLLDLDKRLVEEIGLDWGASYGDMMHFDMRNKGNGKKIHAAIERYKDKKEGESEAQWAKDHE